MGEFHKWWRTVGKPMYADQDTMIFDIVKATWEAAAASERVRIKQDFLKFRQERSTNVANQTELNSIVDGSWSDV